MDDPYKLAWLRLRGFVEILGYCDVEHYMDYLEGEYKLGVPRG